MYQLNQLNRAYYELSDSIKDNFITIGFGGRNSSKSYSVMQIVNFLLWNNPGMNAIWYRKTQADLKEKAFSPFKVMIEKLGLGEYINCVFHHLSKCITYPNGNRLLFDFCSEDKAKGVANIQLIIIDEIDQLSLEDFMMIITSYRGDDSIRFVFMFNPVSKKHWLYNTFFEEGSLYHELSKRFHYTIEDNKFATKFDYMNLDALKDIDETTWRVCRYGEWGNVIVTKPFLDGFSFLYNLAKEPIPFFSDYPLAISFDFGQSETCVYGQRFHDYDIQSDISLSDYFNEDKHAYTRLGEQRIGGAQSNLEVIVQNIVNRFGTDTQYEIVGDIAGGGGSTAERYAELARLFEDKGCYNVKFPPRIKLLQESSRAVSNYLFRASLTNYLVCETNCPGLLNDIRSVKVDIFGKMDKIDAMASDISHFGDANRYLDIYHGLKTFIKKNPYYSGMALRQADRDRGEDLE
jgi:hypothetical protein